MHRSATSSLFVLRIRLLICCRVVVLRRPPYDSADYLKTEADIKNYLEAVFEEPMDRQMLIHTLGVVARARGMMKLSKDTGITRAGLYKALSPDGNPSFETVTKIVGAFGMRLSAQAA
jgi:probable addiction module antidote protein